MDVIGANLDRIKTPGPNDRVYKDECFYSFDSPVWTFLSFFHPDICVRKVQQDYTSA